MKFGCVTTVRSLGILRSVPKQRHRARIGHRSVFDSVARDGSGVAQGRQGENELGSRDAMKGNRTVSLMRLVDPRHQSVEIRQRDVVEHDLERSARQRLVAHEVHALEQAQVLVEPGRGRVVGWGGVGDAGDAVGGEPTGRSLDCAAEIRVAGKAFAEQRVAAEQVSIGYGTRPSCAFGRRSSGTTSCPIGAGCERGGRGKAGRALAG